MRIDTLSRTTVQANKSYTEDLGRGHVNGFFLTAPYDSKITIRLRTDLGTFVIASREPFPRFANNSDHISSTNTRSNYGRKTMFNQAIDAATTGTASVKQYLLLDHMDYVKIPIGSIWLDGGDELEVTVDVGSIGDVAEPSQSDRLAITTYSNNEEPYHLIGYETINDTTTTLYNSVRCYARGVDYGQDPDNPEQYIALTDPSIQLDIEGEGSFLAQYSEFLAASVLEKSIEFSYQPTEPMLFEATTAVLPEVYVRMTGDGVEDIQLFNVWRKYIEEKTSYHTVSQAEKNLDAIKKLQQSDSDQAKALENAGKIPDPKDLQEAIDFVKAKQAAQKVEKSS